MQEKSSAWIVEEGVVVEKGKYIGKALAGIVLGASVGFGAMGVVPHEDITASVNFYWAKIKLPNWTKPIKINSRYNFKKGTKVRVRYYEKDDLPKDVELIVDWD